MSKMMIEIASKMNQINEISRDMLACLKRRDCDVDTVRGLLERRKEIMQKIDDLLADYKAESLTEEEKQTLMGQFASFRSLHEKTQPILVERLDSQLELLGGTTQRKKAEEKYQLSGDPDISYFSHR
jgi:hypothetical protein